MIFQKNTPSHRLTNIDKARLIKRSLSNNSIQFRPIKLKSLQDARNEIKSTSNRKLSFTPTDFDSLLVLNQPNEKQKFTFHPPITENVEFNNKKAEKPFLEKGKIVLKKKQASSMRQSPKKYVARKRSGNRESEVNSSSNSRSFSKPNQPSIIKVLDIIENSKKLQKRLTKQEEKGLITRLQGKTLFKFK